MVSGVSGGVVSGVSGGVVSGVSGVVVSLSISLIISSIILFSSALSFIQFLLLSTPLYIFPSLSSMSCIQKLISQSFIGLPLSLFFI